MRKLSFLSLNLLLLIFSTQARSTNELISAYLENDDSYTVRCSNHQSSNDFEKVFFSDLTSDNVCPFKKIIPTFSTIIKKANSEFDIICENGNIEMDVALSNIGDACGGFLTRELEIGEGLNKIIYADINQDQSFDVYYVNESIERTSFANLIRGNICPGKNTDPKIRFMRKNQKSNDYKVICTNGEKFFNVAKEDFKNICVEIEKLWTMPISQYNCINLFGDENLNNGNIDYIIYSKHHYYFPVTQKPSAIPEEYNSSVICHDVNQFGSIDSELYPRLNLRPMHLTLWDSNDIRFSDLDHDGSPDINDILENEFLKIGNGSATREIFQLLKWPNMPNIPGVSQQKSSNLGLYMQAWIDDNNNGFCPTYKDLNKPAFKEIGKYLSDTEAIYLAESEYFNHPDGAVSTDIMIMRESDLKKIWFYYEGGQHTTPNQNTINYNTIQFYWPVDIDQPYVKKSNSLLYTIRSQYDIGYPGFDTGISSNYYYQSDKRFGCIPKRH